MCHLTASYQSFWGRKWQSEADEYLQDVVEAERFLFESSMAVIMPQVTSGVALLSEQRGTVSYTGHKYSYRLVRR